MKVEFCNVTVRVNGRTILRDLSLRVEEGETLVLLGASGSGKTTALKLINGLRFADEGEVVVDSRATGSWELTELRRKTGYAIQENGLFPHMTVAQNVGIVPRLLGWEQPRIEEAVKRVLEEVQLPAVEFRSRYPHELSGGQRQRVGVARALAADPSLLLFDEPFGALDPLTRLELQRLFLRLQAQHRRTAVVVTHDIAEALRLGTHIALLDEGRLEAIAPTARFRSLDNPKVQAFLGCLET